MKVIDITRNGMTVTCYGEWESDSNAECFFEDESLDNVWCDGANSWTEVVEILTDYAVDNGTVLLGMGAV
jgi:hypothetical protein